MLKYELRAAVKYMITLCTHQNCYKKFYFFFVAKYKNEQKERKFWRQKNHKKRLL